MARHYKTARGRISNAGEHPRFIGLVPTCKAEGGVLQYRSITEMLVAIFLIWSPTVRTIAYEPGEVVFTTADGKRKVAWPDFRICVEGGELEWVNAKYSKASLSARQRLALTAFDERCRAVGERHRVVFRDELERNGFIETLVMLWPYGMQDPNPCLLKRALDIFAGADATHVDEWRRRARAARLPVDVVFHLLYHGRLPVTFRPLMHTSLATCRA